MLEKDFIIFDPHFNNKMPVYVDKPLPERKHRHFEIKDGVRIWVDGKKKNPFEGVVVTSLTLDARIKAGTFVDSEGSPRSLEKVQGSDFLERKVEEAEKEYKERKSAAEEKELRKRRNEEFEKIVNGIKKNTED